ncbi:MFS general substrate transporter [Gloeophyllum trabeum ATCC 11539]|uniref:MFS general substrate transporter n=1 Tax=Gloeophyllum trabeum (strain ATCC 11539 / FP-39264 / Madison 617) TaxID=670483 RepID=S7RXB7_GLOTA|nr:MFS general substrate transporter [Gloeophyllum trabeum ATCC 11539]EPQ57979.1 MFS general substrate transporter [Gloeophyllum trabeum ATCC 11539]
MDSSSDRSEKHAPIAVDASEADAAAQLVAGKDVTLDPQEALRLRRKIDWHLLPLMCILYLMQFADKTTLGQSAVLGILPGAHLNQNQFNWLGTIFYLSYLAFEWPQNLALQRFPVGKWMSINIFIWAIALCSHAACKSFGALFAVRFIMGMAEGAITPGFMIVTSMFYTRGEQTQRVGYWFLMNGVAVIVLGFIAFGVLHTQTDNFMPWQWLMIITGIITLITAVLFWFLFPDSPANAWFLTEQERVLAVERIKVNQAGVENKRFKKEQLIESFKDPKTYMFFFFAAISQLTNQRQLIVNEFGFSTIQTTLLGCVDGVVEIVTIYAGVTLATYIPNGRAYAGALMGIPAILGCILVNTLPSHNRVGLLFSYWLSIFGITPFVIFLAWVGQLTAGHTKRTTTNAIVLIGYGIGNAAGPFMWKKKYQPRNHVPWAVITVCIFVYCCILLGIRAYCVSENKRRDNERRDENYEDVYVTVKNENGTVVEKKVDKAFLDLTDRENLDFRYVL